jgi:hypothetical protein
MTDRERALRYAADVLRFDSVESVFNVHVGSLSAKRYKELSAIADAVSAEVAALRKVAPEATKGTK